MTSLNLLTLAPGGHLGRFIVWTKSAVEALDSIYGTVETASAQKKGWTLPRACATNSDASRLVNDTAVQSIVRAPKEGTKTAKLKKNPLKNLGARLKLDPHFAVKRKEAAAASKKTAAKKGKSATKRAQRMAFYKSIAKDSDYKGDEFEAFDQWLVKNTVPQETAVE